jgi:quercetin dioxygenase-like cupin family protein
MVQMKKSTVRAKEEEPPRAVRLADLVSYQKGSVVSRTMIDKKAGTVTLFAFDEGEGLSEHTAPYDALVFLLEGEAEVVISGKAVLLKEGEMAVMPANEPHSLRATKRFKMMLVMIRS